MTDDFLKEAEEKVRRGKLLRDRIQSIQYFLKTLDQCDEMDIKVNGYKMSCELGYSVSTRDIYLVFYNSIKKELEDWKKRLEKEYKEL